MLRRWGKGERDEHGETAKELFGEKRRKDAWGKFGGTTDKEEEGAQHKRGRNLEGQVRASRRRLRPRGKKEAGGGGEEKVGLKRNTTDNQTSFTAYDT